MPHILYPNRHIKFQYHFLSSIQLNVLRLQITSLTMWIPIIMLLPMCIYIYIIQSATWRCLSFTIEVRKNIWKKSVFVATECVCVWSMLMICFSTAYFEQIWKRYWGPCRILPFTEVTLLILPLLRTVTFAQNASSFHRLSSPKVLRVPSWEPLKISVDLPPSAVLLNATNNPPVRRTQRTT